MHSPGAADTPAAVLFLQGPPSPFAREWGAALSARGAEVHHVNLCLGDWIYWHGPGTHNYRGGFAGWRRWLERFIDRHAITDLIYFADRHPYHRVAQAVAGERGIAASSYEYGYLRPDWIIFEPRGQSSYSHFTEDMARIRHAAKGLPPPEWGVKYTWDFKDEADGDVTYHLANYLGWLLYPGFRRDRVYNPIREYLSYIPRNRRAARGRAEALRLVEELRSGSDPYFVVPLQMQNDYQIRLNSPYPDQRGFLTEVLTSFAAHAPTEARLVVKIHPLDNGIEDWAAHVAQMVAHLGLGDRVRVLDGGDLQRLIERAAGMVTINSTSGVAALQAGCPLKVMGIAAFDLDGLTHQGEIDTFWQAPFRPDPGDLAAFFKVFARHVHVRGNFYGAEGRAAAIAELCDRMLTPGEPMFDPAVFDAEPPRLDRARRIGVPMDG